MNSKNLLFAFAFFLPSLFFGQVSNIVIDSCGITTDGKLNSNEAMYFNKTYGEVNGFDFQGKKLAFTHGNAGEKILSKKEYFDRWGKEYFNEGKEIMNQVILLTEAEQKSTGYDAIIVSWSKLPIDASRRSQVVKQFSRR